MSPQRRVSSVAALILALAATACTGAAAAADWTAFSADVDQRGPLVISSAGTVYGTSYGSGSTVNAFRVAADGRGLAATPLASIMDGLITPFGKDGVVGSTGKGSTVSKSGNTYWVRGLNSAGAATASDSDAFRGRYKEWPLQVAGNTRGDVAVLVGSHTKRSVWLRRAGTTAFHLALRVPGGNVCVWQCPMVDAAITLGPAGDLFAAWEDRNLTVRSRYLPAKGGWHATETLGRGTLAERSIQVAVTQSSRRYVLFRQQRGPDQLLSGTTHRDLTHVAGIPVSHVKSPGGYWERSSVRMVSADKGQALLAWREARGDSDHRIVVADLVNGKLVDRQTLAATGVLDLSGAGVARNGAAAVAWETDKEHGHQQRVTTRVSTFSPFAVPTTLDTGALRWNQSVLIAPDGSRAYVSFLGGKGFNLASTPVAAE